MTDGTLLRGEVLARWQEFVGTGEFFRQVETTISRWRDRLTAAIKGRRRRPRAWRGAPERCRRAARSPTPRRRRPDGPRLAPASRAAPRADAAPDADQALAGPPPRRRAARPRVAGRGARAGAHRGPGPAHQRADRGLRAQRDRPVPHARGVRQHRWPRRCRDRHRGWHRPAGASASSRRSSATRRSATWRPRPARASSRWPTRLYAAERERYAAALAESAPPADQAAPARRPSPPGCGRVVR